MSENKEIKRVLEDIRNNVGWLDEERRSNNIVLNGVEVEAGNSDI